MIQFTEQKKRAMRGDCRVWTEHMASAWYASDFPRATDYPADKLVSDLRVVYFTCHEGDVDNVEYISLLGFIVLRANTLGCNAGDMGAIVEYFLHHARGNHVHYVQNWIETYLAKVA